MPNVGAGERDDEALGQHLTNHLPDARAHRDAHRHLLRAHRGAGEQEVRDVRAGDEQHERDRRHHEQEHRPEVAGLVLAQRLHVDAPAEVRRGILRLERRGDAVEVQACLVDCNVRLEPTHHLPRVIAAVLRAGRSASSSTRPPSPGTRIPSASRR